MLQLVEFIFHYSLTQTNVHSQNLVVTTFNNDTIVEAYFSYYREHQIVFTIRIGMRSFLWGMALLNRVHFGKFNRTSALSQKSFPGYWQFKLPRGFYGVGC